MLCAGPCRVLLDSKVLVMYGLFFPLPPFPQHQVGFVSNCPLKKSCFGLYDSKISLFDGRIPLGDSRTKFVQNTNTGISTSECWRACRVLFYFWSSRYGRIEKLDVRRKIVGLFDNLLLRSNRLKLSKWWVPMC